jgi:hypothetical protein
LISGLNEFKKTLGEEVTKENNWEKSHDKDGDKIYTKKLEKLNLTRIETEIDGSPEEIIKELKNLELRKSQDKNLIEISMIEQIDENTGIYYTLENLPIMFMVNRDFVVLYGVVKQDDTTYFIQRSTEHLSKPVTKKNLRAIIHQSNWCIVPF